MVILLLTGIKEELSGLLERRPFAFERDLRVYHSTQNSGLYAATTGPGVRHASHLKQLLEALLPDVIVNAGLVGILDERDALQTGDRLKLGEVIRADTETIYPGGPGQHRLVTVERPVHDLLDRMDLVSRYHARACDMEAARIIQLVGSVKSLQNNAFVHFVKVVGDRPEEATLFEYEYMLWDWRRKNAWGKLRTMMRFPGGPAAFFRLRKKKRNALSRLTEEIVRTIRVLEKTGGIPAGMGSVFIPH
jgi:hypothetical protein